MKNNPGEYASEPILLQGDLFFDDRGSVGFVNNFDMRSVRRFYTVTNHRKNFVRAWHAHKNEEKYVTVINGSAVIGTVCIDNWEKPSKELKIYRHILSSEKPSVLFIPKGYANGFMTLTSDAKLMFFSTATIEESQGDDIRYDAYYWNPWEIEER